MVKEHSSTPVFTVGQKVKAIKVPVQTNAQDRVLGDTYKVTAVKICPNTGHQSINVNNNLPKASTGLFDCTYCGRAHSNEGLAWTRSTFFEAVEDYSIF